MRFDRIVREFQVFSNWMNFTKAARELGITQSNLSKHMAQLEREVGAQLIGRMGTEMFLTPAGKVFLEESSLLLASYYDLKDRCRTIAQLPETRLVFQEQLQNEATMALYSLARKYQSSIVDENISISFIVLQRSNLSDALREGKIDVGIDVKCMGVDEHRSDLERRGLCAAPLVSEPMVAWLRKDNPLTEKGSDLRLEDFYNVPIMTTAGDAYDYIGDAIRDLFAREGRNPRFRMIVQDAHWGLSDYFMTDLADSVLFTTVGATNDVRLSSRSDIGFVLIDDDRLRLSSTIVAKMSNLPARNFVEFAAVSLGDD